MENQPISSQEPGVAATKKSMGSSFAFAISAFLVLIGVGAYFLVKAPSTAPLTDKTAQAAQDQKIYWAESPGDVGSHNTHVPISIMESNPDGTGQKVVQDNLSGNLQMQQIFAFAPLAKSVFSVEGNNIVSIDLQTGEKKVIYQNPTDGKCGLMIQNVVVNPEASQIVAEIGVGADDYYTPECNTPTYEKLSILQEKNGTYEKASELSAPPEVSQMEVPPPIGSGILSPNGLLAFEGAYSTVHGPLLQSIYAADLSAKKYLALFSGVSNDDPVWLLPDSAQNETAYADAETVGGNKVFISGFIDSAGMQVRRFSSSDSVVYTPLAWDEKDGFLLAEKTSRTQSPNPSAGEDGPALQNNDQSLGYYAINATTLEITQISDLNSWLKDTGTLFHETKLDAARKQETLVVNGVNIASAKWIHYIGSSDGEGVSLPASAGAKPEADSVSNWPTYSDPAGQFSIQYLPNSQISAPVISGDNSVSFTLPGSRSSLTVSAATKAWHNGIFQAPADCNDTSDGANADETHSTIGGVDFFKINLDRDMSTATNAASAREYCAIRNGIGYKVISKISYAPGAATPPNADTDPVLNQMLASFRIISSDSAMKSYSNGISGYGGFSLMYPSDFIVDQNFINKTDSGSKIPGVSFSAPASYLANTNASAVTISVEQYKNAGADCVPDNFINQVSEGGVTDNTLTKDGDEWASAEADDAALGTFRFEIAAADDSQYAPSGNDADNICFALHMTAGTHRLEDFPAGTENFDAHAFFQKILGSFHLTGTSNR